jgi:competence protein ComEC
MEPTRSPAVGPALSFVVGLWAATRLAIAPGVGSAAVLLALGAGLGGPVGRAVAAAAGGALVAVVRAPSPQPLEPGRVIEAVGRIAERTRRYDDGGSSVPLITESIRSAHAIAAGGSELRLDLPAEISPPPPGARVRVRGTLTRSAGFANERPVEPGPWRVRVKSAVFLATESPPDRLARVVQRFRRLARGVFEHPRTRDRPGIAVVRSLLMGEAEALPERWRRALRRTGLAHLIAVSGFNVSLVAALAGAIGAGLPRRARLTLAAAAVALYGVLVGPAPSVLRAGAMGLLALVGLALERAPRALQTLAVATVSLLAFEPALIDDPGFRLSVAATSGLLLLAPRWVARRSGSWPRPLAIAVAACLAAQAAALPWSVASFGELSPLAPLWNLVATPWAAIALVAGAVWTALAAVAPDVAAGIAPLLDPLAWPLEGLARLPPSPWISIACPGGFTAGVAAALPLVALGEGGRVARSGLLVLLLALAAGHGPVAPAGFEALFVDVGQGDAALLDDGENAILVDGGGAPGRDLGGRLLRPVLVDRGRTTVALAVVSHADSDHCLGLLDLAAQVSIEELWVPAGVGADPCVEELGRRIPGGARPVVAGLRRRFGRFLLEVVHPDRLGGRGDDNSGSLVLAVSGGGRRLLFTGDLDAATERRLSDRIASDLRADLLKVAHHGSARSSDAAFLGAVSPRLAVVSAGVGNAYGHPAPGALARLDSVAPLVLRTDRDGAVRVRWREGRPWTIELPASPRAVGARP